MNVAERTEPGDIRVFDRDTVGAELVDGETIAQALLDYVDLGADIISMRGYDILNDAIDVGRYVIPIVREEVAKRDRKRDALASAR